MTAPWFYFFDPVLRAPTLGSMLMCLAAGLVGVWVFLRRQSLIGEVLSHSAYPGVILGIMLVGAWGLNENSFMALSIIGGATITAWLGLWCIQKLQQKLKIKPDSALCFILSAFFGVGITLASNVQFAFPTLYKQVQVYLYGQAATMTDIHIYIYGTLVLLVLGVLAFFYKELHLITFDRPFAKTMGYRVNVYDELLNFLVVLAVVIGIRSVGVVLMSAMLIAPAVAARQYTHQMSKMFLWAGIFGLVSGFFGTYLSVELSAPQFSLPTGPMIVMVAATICFLSLLIAPEKGALPRLWRGLRFRYKCLCENILKGLWRSKGGSSSEELQKFHLVSRPFLGFILHRLEHNGWVKVAPSGLYQLTHEGEKWAARIVRLHRLWEVYLVDYMGTGVERVHRSAEEIEHILTPDLEKELVTLLQDPKEDPHHQPIPPRPEP